MRSSSLASSCFNSLLMQPAAKLTIGLQEADGSSLEGGVAELGSTCEGEQSSAATSLCSSWMAEGWTMPQTCNPCPPPPPPPPPPPAFLCAALRRAACSESSLLNTCAGLLSRLTELHLQEGSLQAHAAQLRRAT